MTLLFHPLPEGTDVSLALRDEGATEVLEIHVPAGHGAELTAWAAAALGWAQAAPLERTQRCEEGP